MPTNNDSVERLRREHGAGAERGASDAQGGKPATVEALRGDIDSGKTGDKVDFPDPAAVPLGADDEAGGHSPNRPEMASARAAASAATHGVSAAAVPGVDQSAGESGAPADMDYYRTDNEGGSKLALNALALPIILVLLIVFGAIWFWL